jgi:hypothetical protein
MRRLTEMRREVHYVAYLCFSVATRSFKLLMLVSCSFIWLRVWCVGVGNRPSKSGQWAVCGWTGAMRESLVLRTYMAVRLLPGDVLLASAVCTCFARRLAVPSAAVR